MKTRQIVIMAGWMSGIHLFVGAGALLGGLAAVFKPQSPLGISTEMLKKGPFTSYLVPGLFLLLVLGGGNLISALLMYKKVSFRGFFSGILGGILMLWILIQCYILESIGFLHVLFFLLGSAQGLMATVFLYQLNMFPADLVNKLIHGKKRRPTD